MAHHDSSFYTEIFTKAGNILGNVREGDGIDILGTCGLKVATVIMDDDLITFIVKEIYLILPVMITADKAIIEDKNRSFRIKLFEVLNKENLFTVGCPEKICVVFLKHVTS